MDYEKIYSQFKKMGENAKYDTTTLHQCIRVLIDATSLTNAKEAMFRDQIRKVLRSSVKQAPSAVSIPQPIAITKKRVNTSTSIKTFKKRENQTGVTKEQFLKCIKESNCSLKYELSVFYNNQWITKFWFDHSKGSPYFDHGALVMFEDKKKVVIPYKYIKITEKENHATLKKMAELIMEGHRDVFDSLLKQFPLVKLRGYLENIAYKIGKSAGSLGGTCSWSNDIISINRGYSFQQVNRDILQSVFRILYHELLHIFYHNHRGNFYFWNNKFNPLLLQDPRCDEFLPFMEKFKAKVDRPKWIFTK